MSRQKKKKSTISKPIPEEQALPAEKDWIYVWADNLLFSLTLLILFLRPFVSGRTYPHYNHLFHMGVCVLGILWLIKSWRSGALELHNRLLTGFMFAFLLVCSFTFFTTIHKGLTLRYIYEITSYTLLFLVIANNFREGFSIKTAVATLLIAALLVNIYGLYQRYYTLEMTRRHIESAIASRNQELFLGIPLGPGILDRLGSTRVFSSFLFPNAYAMYLGFMSAVAIGWTWSMHGAMKKFARSVLDSFFAPQISRENFSPLKRAAEYVKHYCIKIGGLLLTGFFIISCVLIPWNLWLTYSRGGWLSAVVIVFVIFTLMVWRKIAALRRNLAVLIFLSFFLGSVLMSGNADSAQKIHVREESLLQRLKDSTTIVQRFSYWETGWEMIKDKPWFGVGWGAFEKAYPRYMLLGGYPVKLAHNNYLQVWAETGVVGLNAFVGMWLIFCYAFWRKVRSESVGELRGIAIGLGAGVFGFLAHSMVDFDLYLPTLTYFVFALMGLLVAVPAQGDEEDKFTIRLPITVTLILIICACTYFLFLFRSFMGLSIANRVETERNTAFPTAFAMKRGFKPDPEKQRKVLEESIPFLKKSIRYFPLDADAHHMLGDTYLRLAQAEDAPYLLDEAITSFQRAGELNPLSPYVFQSLATAYWLYGNKMRKPEMFHKALQAEKRASENFPVNPEYHAKLAQIYRALRMKEEAKQETDIAGELRKHYKDH